MVVARDRGELDTSVDQEVDESGLHLGLSGLEVVTANEGSMLLSELNRTGNEGVLRRAVDVGNFIENTGNGEDGRGRNFLVTILNCLQEVIGSVVDAGDQIGVSLRVGRPQDDDLVQTIGRLEVALDWSVSGSSRRLHHQVRLTGCLFGSVQRAPWMPWIL
jgi:hypothetical protein